MVWAEDAVNGEIDDEDAARADGRSSNGATTDEDDGVPEQEQQEDKLITVSQQTMLTFLGMWMKTYKADLYR